MEIKIVFPDLGDIDSLAINTVIGEWFIDRFLDKSPENESFIKYAKRLEIKKDGIDDTNLSGPITNCPGFESAFQAAENHLVSKGYTVITPVEIGEEIRRTCRLEGMPQPRWADYMRADIQALILCEMVVAIGDFWHSRGAMVELRIAEALGMPIFELTADQNLKPVVLKKVW